MLNIAVIMGRLVAAPGFKSSRKVRNPFMARPVAEIKISMSSGENFMAGS